MPPSVSKCPDSILRLVERFNQHADTIRAAGYNETQIRIDFINPMFAALGWDMDNTQAYAEQYREVVHEDKVKVAGQTKAPDYSFRVGGQRKFFLEAKKPAVDIKDNWEPAYQLRRYAWSAKLACSLLTDFEELAIYDTRQRPVALAKPSVARREYISYTDYESRWDFIDGTFSKAAVLRGDFDKYCDTKKGRGVELFDDAFLAEIEDWRKSLASNLALRNESLDGPGLNFAVQRIIDRILFLRIAEDRGTETIGQLQSLLNGDHVYDRLKKLFRDADARYNSGIFHFQKEKDRDEAPDTLTPDLDIDDKALKQIIEALYYPKSPYEFTMVSADILGSVYERFLGKVITLTAGHRAKVEEKPEVRKAGGVYYTPTYIVDYIVKNTVGKLLEGKTPAEARKGVKVLDPACGSGSFLIGAYQFLLDWHLDQYTKELDQSFRVPDDSDGKVWSKQSPAPGTEASDHSPTPPRSMMLVPKTHLVSGKSAVLRPTHTGGYALTIAERKRILLDHIHGVDLDSQAVEVTKLNLLLKCLEGETSQTLGFEAKLFKERALPDLGHNILCGNSLIGTDIVGTEAWKEMTDAEHARVNPFDYPHAFPKAYKGKEGGFDAVIGNPPYVRQESLKASKAYFESHYRSFASTADLFIYFIERGVRLLTKDGIYSVIVSSSVLRSTYGESLRELLQSDFSVDAITDFGGLSVFAEAKDTYVCIPTISRRKPSARVAIARVTELPEPNAHTIKIDRAYEVPREQLTRTAWSINTAEHQELFRRLMTLGSPLGRYVQSRFFSGVKTGFNDAFILDASAARDLQRDKGSLPLIHEFVGGEDIRTYYIERSGKWMIVIPQGWTASSLGRNPRDQEEAYRHLARTAPAISKHLKQFEPELEKRQDQGDYWWELRPCDYYHAFDKPKLIFPDICKNPRFCYDETGLYLTNTAYCLGTDDKRLLGFLNSKLFWFLIASISIPFGIRAGQYRYRLIYQYMEHVPIRIGEKDARQIESSLVKLVDAMLVIHAKLAAEELPQRREQLQREIDATDRQIDALVYQLYGLTEAEIKIVEEATAKT